MTFDVSFEDWTTQRVVPSLGSNSGAPTLPFQGWRRFKEAFAPELVDRAISGSEIPVRCCLDPFGGSGSTALACQFLGRHSVTIEVNPFLADLIEAKLSVYDVDKLARSLGAIVRRARTHKRLDRRCLFPGAPPTFIEPGVNGRWIFDRPVADRVVALANAVEQLSDETHRRLFRVLLGGALVDVSNVVISGKGRRYRRGWEDRRRDPEVVDELFCNAAQHAIAEIHRYGRRACRTYEIRRGDCRQLLDARTSYELAVFSPPYPNSFDYTDVYNVELWALGYLTDKQSNHTLRRSTLCSHIQLSREFPTPPIGSFTLDETLERLAANHDDLWDHRIPSMLGGYFGDMMSVLADIRRSISQRGSVWMVLGDSRYAGVQVETAKIIAELATREAWKLELIEPCRSMRASPQQGGRVELAETLVVLTRST